jgi:hypothetical protein
VGLLSKRNDELSSQDFLGASTERFKAKGSRQNSLVGIFGCKFLTPLILGRKIFERIGFEMILLIMFCIRNLFCSLSLSLGLSSDEPLVIIGEM